MVEDKKLRQYLLGQLPESERDTLEDRLIVEGGLRDEVEAVERDLIDAYVRGELNGEDLKRFEQLFFASAIRQEKIRFAQALSRLDHPRVDPAVVEPQAEKWSLLSFLFPRERPALAFGFAALVLALFLGAIWFLVLRETQPNNRVQVPNGGANAPVGPVVQASPHPTAEPSPVPGVTPETLKPEVQSVATFLLLPGAVRGTSDVQSLEIPAETKFIRLRLSLEGLPATGKVRAELRRQSADGAVVWTSGVMSAQSSSQGPVVPLELPASKVVSGRYAAVVKDAGKEQLVQAIYNFNVTRK